MYEEICCCTCGIIFNLDSRHLRNLRENHRTFHCPNGHGQSFEGETEADRIRKELSEEKDKRWKCETANRELESRLRNYKGQITKLKKGKL